MKKDVLMPLLASKWNFGNTTLIWVQTAETFWSEMVLTNAVMEGETKRHANAGEEFQSRYCFWSRWKSIAVSMTLYTECKWYLRWGAWPRYLSRWRVCIRWQRLRRWVWTRWCRKWIICKVWKLRTKCRKCCCKKATSSRIWTALLIWFYEKRVGLIKSKLLLACLLHPA